MSFATATTWFFNFVVSITFPRLLGAFTPQGAFAWYAGWNAIGFVLVLLFVPETKALSLEELDQVFSVPTHTHATYQIKALGHNLRSMYSSAKLVACRRFTSTRARSATRRTRRAVSGRREPFLCDSSMLCSYSRTIFHRRMLKQM